MTHPSIQGLREAMWLALCDAGCTEDEADVELAVIEKAIATYLTEHGVGWFGEGLVRAVTEYRHARSCGRASTTATFVLCSCDPALHRLVPVPQDGE